MKRFLCSSRVVLLTSPVLCLSAIVFAQNMEGQNHSSHVFVKTTFAWQNMAVHAGTACLNHSFFPVCLTMLPFGISSLSFCTSACYQLD